jgi:D-alanyl-D-alanine dipeptidase
MPVLRSRRSLAVAVALTGSAVATALAPGAVAAPVPNRALPAAPAIPVVLPVAAGPVAVAGHAVPRAEASAPRVVRTATRLALTLTPGKRPTDPLSLLGVLRRRDGARVPGRPIVVYVRRGDAGTWQRAVQLQGTVRGVVRHRLLRTPDLQVTLRFAGDTRYGPAASVLLAPDPTARALSPALVRAVGSARAAARRAGLTLVVNSGYRSRSKQQALYDAALRQYGSARAARRWVLPPAESTHLRGLAVDVGAPATAAWLARRGARWGLCRTYAGEPWHFEYRPDWVKAFGTCPPPVAMPGDPAPLSPWPRVPVR